MPERSVLLISPGFPASEDDSTCLPYLQVFVKEMAKQCSLRVIALHYPFEQKSYTWHGVPVFAAGGRNRNSMHKLLLWLLVMRHALDVKTDVRLVHSFWLGEAAFVGSAVAGLSGVPHVISLMGQDAAFPGIYEKMPFWRRALITACSPRARWYFESRLNKKIVLTSPWGVESETRMDGARTIELLGVGNLTRIKNFQLFVDLCATLRTGHSDLRAVIIGEGEEEAALRAKIRELGLDHNITLTGKLAREEVMRHMRNAKVLLHTSSYEGQGYVFQEALANGMRIVAMDVGYLPQSPWVYICKKKEDLHDSILLALSSDAPQTTPPIVGVNETVRDFAALYERAVHE